MPYTPTIGLEIHAELNTRTKMFCACANNPDEKRPNVNICPVCMAHPGSLPTINKEAVRKVLLVGTALGGRLADRTWFDRKNYFYPDIPKGYQISQYKDPLVSGGELAGVAITRVHLEEDTARSQHGPSQSDVDFNRAGVALMELVTEPCIRDAETAGRFARELQLLLRYLGVSEANMEQGQMRVEANVSVSATSTFGTKVEVKNLNSFRSVERAIRYETARQIEVLENGGAVAQETRGWDERREQTFSQRSKESAHDYRYFPEPDLPTLKISEISEFSRENSRKDLPELPSAKRTRYANLGLKSEDIETFVQDQSGFLVTLFEETAKRAAGDSEFIRLAANYITSDIQGFLNKEEGSSPNSDFGAASFVDLMRMVRDGKLSSRGAKDVLAEIYLHGGTASDVAQKKNLLQQSDAGALKAIARKVIEAHPSVVDEYKAGKTASLQFLVGQGMKESHGSANPQALKDQFEKILG
ncbi:MAG: Asp-tRNA(Asn)/Glu-tRNA(Gln) amidotransferase subunit GatB [Minisyncoccia bacterium]